MQTVDFVATLQRRLFTTDTWLRLYAADETF